MKFEATLTTRDLLWGTKEGIENVMREGFTDDLHVGSIVGLDKQDGGGILISRESWTRLKVFMGLLSSIKMSISEEMLKAIMEKKPNK
jgi:hypothetical protein